MKKKLILSLLFAYISISSPKRCEPSVTTVTGSWAPHAPYCSGDLLFEDNFESFDFTKWKHTNTISGNGNREFQWDNNNRTNSYVKDGRLYLQATLLSDQFGEEFLSSGTLNIHGGSPADECSNQAWDGCEKTGTPEEIINPMKSARVLTLNSFRFKYGRVEVNAKMPTGDWLWPAIWLMPAKNEYGTWPVSGEIDMVECRGNEDMTLNGINIGSQQMESTLHFGPYPSLNAYYTANFKRNNDSGYNSDFIRYQMEWTPEYVKFSINDQHLGTIDPGAGFWEYGNFDEKAPGISNPWRHGTKMAPFDQEFYIILNLSVGGAIYFPDDAENPDKKPWINWSSTSMRDFYEARDVWLKTWHLEDESIPSAFQIDSVKIWAL